MEIFKIGKERIAFYGKKNGSNTNKFNRVNKLANMYNELHAKLIAMAERGKNSCTENYRCAVATLLLLETGIRVGNESSAEGYNTVPHPHNKDQSTKFVKTYGLTTLLRKHVKYEYHNRTRGGVTIRFNFDGKKQVKNTFEVPMTLTHFVRDIYENCGKDPVFGITNAQLTKFIKVYVGRQFSPKDMRTLRANIYAAKHFANTNNFPHVLNKGEVKAQIKLTCEFVSEQLNNTPGVCKKSYINADLFERALHLYKGADLKTQQKYLCKH